MDMTAYWLNFKKKRAGERKYYYFYPYTRSEADVTPTLFIAGKHYVRLAVSEEEWRRLRKLDDKEYNSERRAHNKRWTADIPRLQDEDGEEIDFWSDRAEDSTKAASRSGNRLASAGENLYAPRPHAAARRRAKQEGACL